jgi:hypothetical protein
MIGEIIEKAVIRGEVLSNEERNALLEFFARVERADTDVNRDVSASMSALFPRLSDISAIMGTVVAGEFRSGNFKTPGDGFTGGRFGWPGFTYGGTEYFLAGVLNDVLQVGLALADGTIKAGAGDVTIDSDGIWVTNQQAAFGFEDTGGNRFKLYIYSDADDNIGIINELAGKGIVQFIRTTNTNQVSMIWKEGSVANSTLLQIGAGTAGGTILLGAGVSIWSGRDGTETVFNEDSYDIDFRVESATNANFFKIDAGAETLAIGGDTTLDGAVEINTSNAAKNFTVHGDTQDGVFVVDGALNRVEIGNTTNAVHIIDPNSTTYFNEPGNDLDTIFRGATDDNLLTLDAGLDRVGIGTIPENKLDVLGPIKAQVLLHKDSGLLFEETNVDESFFYLFGDIGVAYSGYLRTFLQATSNPTELITNGTFEGNNLTGWTQTGTPSVVSPGYESTYAARCTDTNTIKQTITVVSGSYYLLRFSARMDDDADFHPIVTITNGDQSAYDPGPQHGGRWIRGAALIKATSTTMVLEFHTAGTNFVYFDDISLKTVADFSQFTAANGEWALVGSSTGTLLSIDGGVIINDSGNDRDTRIEGNNNDQILNIDAGLDTAVSFVWTGWGLAHETWTRTGNHTFTLSGDETATYRKGAKIRYKDGGSYEYGVIASSTHAAGTTTITLITNTDYAMAAATITDKYISYIENPEGFPHYFNWDAAPAGFSAVPTGQTYRWHVKGKTIFCEYVELTNGTSNATTFTASGPVVPLQGVTAVGGTLVDNGALRTVAGRVTMGAGSTAIAFRTDMANGAWTNANGKRAVCYWSYEF